MTRPAAKIAMVGLLTTLVAGCIPMPVPTLARAPRFTQQQVDAVGREAQSRGSLEEKLGPPDLHRDGDRIWIYTWTEDYGAWELEPIKGQWSDNRWSPVESHRFLWVFEFDNQGKVVSQELVRDARESSGGAYCSSNGICVTHYSLESDVEFGYLKRFQNESSAVTVKGPAATRVSSPAPQPDECLVFIWPDKEWDSKVSAISDDGGAEVAVEGAPLWPRWRWLPSRAFARISLPAGEHAVSVHDLTKPDESLKSSTRTFSCRAGERVYIALGGAEKDSNHFPIELRPVDASTAQTLIENMAQVLPPD